MDEKVKKTFIIMGRYRGGTSMLTQMLDVAGIYVGEKKFGNWEDPDFVPTQMGGDMENIQYAANAIRDRNILFEHWGFKFPGSWRYLSNLMPWLKPKPHLLVIYRDPWAVADSEARRAKIAIPVSQIMGDYAQMENVVRELEVNDKAYVTRFSYEHALIKPTEFCQKVGQIVNCPAEKLEPIIGSYDKYGSKNWEY